MITDKLGNITLYNADCMELLREMPDKSYDLAIVDPPYGDGNFQNPSHQAMKRDGGGWFNRYKKPMEQVWTTLRQIQESRPNSVPSQGGSGSTNAITPPHSEGVKKGIWWDIAPNEEYFKELFRVSKNQIIWGANYFSNMPPTRCFIVWRKPNISEKFSMAMAEYAWTSFNKNAKVFEAIPQGTAKEPRFHPTQKPVALYVWLLNNYAKQGWKILDTHLGSGSIAIACHDLGFELTGIELDPDYYEKAVKRIKNHQLQLKLF